MIIKGRELENSSEWGITITHEPGDWIEGWINKLKVELELDKKGRLKKLSIKRR